MTFRHIKLLFQVLLVLSFAAVAVYIITRLMFFFSVDYTILEKFLSTSLLLAEMFILIHCIAYSLNVLRVFLKRPEETFIYSPLPQAQQPGVAILVAARHEPREVLEKTFGSLVALNYSNKQIYFLDDSSEESYKKEAQELCHQLGLNLFRRDVRHGAKAGIINDCLKSLTQKYVVVFDADQCPLPEFLNVLVPRLEANPQLGFIQTPQFYSNMAESRVAKASSFQQAVFYEYICEGKDVGDAMFCCGTNIIFRREALAGVGGFDESTVTEDIATSVKIHASGWHSLYYGHVSTFGMGPENLTGYFKQQFRWASGTLTLAKTLFVKLVTCPSYLKPGQWWEYIISSSYYLSGFAFFILMVCPVLYLLFNLPSFFNRPEIYFFTFIPYFGLSITLFYMVLGHRHYKIDSLFIGQMLSAVTFSIYMRAAFSVLLGHKIEFGITQKTKGKPLPYWMLWPQISMIFLNIVAATWGINRYIYEQNQSLLVNAFWAAYHAFILSGIIYFNDEDFSKADCQSLKGDVKFNYQILNQGLYQDLDKAVWHYKIKVFIRQPLDSQRLLMCKVMNSKNSVVFDGQVIWSSTKKSFKGYETHIGIVTIPQSQEAQLKEMIR